MTGVTLNTVLSGTHIVNTCVQLLGLRERAAKEEEEREREGKCVCVWVLEHNSAEIEEIWR